MKSQHFDISFSTTDGPDEHMFLSVTPGFEHGPGIQRDGISNPRMTDPHKVAAVLNSHRLDKEKIGSDKLPDTTIDPFVQRSGTWTLYHHLKHFFLTHGDDWKIVGIQSNGDLTMNYWHVAYMQRDIRGLQPSLCGLRTNGDPQEPIGQRTYRALVKWTTEVAACRGGAYEFLDIQFEPIVDERWAVKAVGQPTVTELDEAFVGIKAYDSDIHDLGPLMEFALSGKPIVEKGINIPFANAIDRFEDIRHVFNLPTVQAEGFFRGSTVTSANFGEYQLFKNLNERRAALSSPIVVDLKIGDSVVTYWETVRNTLITRHYAEVSESPTRRGQFRKYADGKVEIYFPHNVYPFGVIGIKKSDTDTGKQLVGLSSGGLSGRVGNTLEGIAQIMFDFFSCTDAMVLDEGFDVFSVSNPKDGGNLRYTNDDILKKLCAFSKHRLDMDASEAKKKSASYPFGNNLKNWPLNIALVSELEKDFKDYGDASSDDILLVPPLRSQMRSVLIFATKEAK